MTASDAGRREGNIARPLTAVTAEEAGAKAAMGAERSQPLLSNHGDAGDPPFASRPARGTLG